MYYLHVRLWMAKYTYKLWDICPCLIRSKSFYISKHCYSSVLAYVSKLRLLQKSLHLLVTIQLFPRMPPSSTSLVKLHQLLHLLAVVKLQGSPHIFPVKPTSVLWGNKLGLKKVWQCSCVFEQKSNLHITVIRYLWRCQETGHFSLLKCFFLLLPTL